MRNGVTLVTAKMQKLLYCVRARAREEVEYRLFHSLNFLSPMSESNEFSITGRTFAVSERSQKTTRRFV